MKIDKKTRKAIEISIEKWKGIAEFGLRDCTKEYADYIEQYSEHICHCPLCDIYIESVEACKGCPLNTKSTCCTLKCSPYHKWHKSKTSKTASKYAQQLVDILKGFLK